VPATACVYKHVHSPNWKTAQCLDNSRLAFKTVVHPYDGTLHSNKKKNEPLTKAIWVKLTNKMISEKKPDPREQTSKITQRTFWSAASVFCLHLCVKIR
jgi:hypothetical protein